MRVDSTPYFVLKDHLGSASVITDASGNTVGEQRYYPFGETRVTTGTIPTDKLFTGQREMAGLGIYHYGARFYSPYITQFSQPDSIVPDPYNPQSLNRYSYALNNPIRYTDPTGHRPCEDYQGSCLSEKQVTKIHKEKQEKIKKKNKEVKEKRDPDYVTLNVGGSIPGLGTLVSGQGVLTLDRYGNVYFGLGVAFGPEAPLGLSASLSAGFLDHWSNSLTPGNAVSDPPNQAETQQILSGGFANGTVCLIFCGGLTNSLSNLDNVGFEVLGIGVPQLSVGAGNSWHLIDFTDGETPIW